MSDDAAYESGRVVVDPPPPYFCQFDNRLDPGGTCNLTSLSMGLDFYGKHYTPDQLHQWCDQNGVDRHTLEGIAACAKAHGIIDEDSYTTSWEEIKAHLRTNNPVIVHGYFTPRGHIVLVCGFDQDKGLWLVNDPAGDWMAPNRYHNPGWREGRQVWYPSTAFRHAADPDSANQVWAHRLKA